MWQKCPICNGIGKVPVNYDPSSTVGIFSSSEPCRVCNGTGIISELTGLPPKGVETFASPKYRNSDGSPITDFRDNCEQFDEK